MTVYACWAPGCTRGTRARMSLCYVHRGVTGVKRPFVWLWEISPTWTVRSSSKRLEDVGRSLTGETTRFVRYLRSDGALSRLDGPAVIEYRHDGTKIYERWYRDGEMHRDGDLPAQTDYLPDGSVRSEQWYVRGERHRIGAPAWMRLDTDLDARYEAYYRHGQQHRIDGPAITTFHRNGQITEQWFLTDALLPGPEMLGQVLAFSDSTSLLPAFLTESSYATLMAEGYTAKTIVGAISAGVISLHGIRAFAAGAPVEWARAYESAPTT